MTTWRNYYGIKKIAELGVTMMLINGFIDIINVFTKRVGAVKAEVLQSLE